MSFRISRKSLGVSLCLAALAVWSFFVSAVLMSYHRQIQFAHARYYWEAICLDHGTLYLLRGERRVVVKNSSSSWSSTLIGWDAPIPPGTVPESVKQDEMPFGNIDFNRVSSGINWPPFSEEARLGGGSTLVIQTSPRGSIMMPMGRNVTARAMSAWLLVFATAAPGWVLIIVAAVRSTRGKRAGIPRCAGCGYDLRASPQRCPECGRPV